MKNRKIIDLDVDFIGGERTLTKEDEKAISDYIKADKLKRAKKTVRKGNHLSNDKIKQYVYP